MSTNIDNRLHKSNDTPSMSLKSALSLGSESESARTVSMNKAATTTYLNSLSYEQDDVGDSLSRSMNKLNQSLSQAASANHESAVDEQAEKMAVYSKLAGKLIDRDSSLQEKVAQDLSKNSNIVRTKDASESLQKAMGNLPSALKEGTQAGKDLAKFMVENLVTLSDRKQMGAGLERDLAVRQINIPKSQPNSRLQNASSKVLSASIEYVKNNQPEVLTKIAAQEASQAKAQSQAALASETMNSAKSTDNSDAPDSTYLSALKAQRAQQNKTQAPDTSTKPSAPQDKISAEISKRIHNLIAQAAQTAKSGNLINLSPEEAERFDRTITSQNQQAQVKGDPLERILSNTSVNAADGELPPPSKQTPEANVRQLSLSELSARASKLQSQFRQERMRIVQEGKLPDPAQMPETNFDKDSIKATIDASKQQQESVQNQQRASHTSSLYESLARARSAFSAHNITSEAAAQEQPATTESKPAPQTTEQKPATQADSKPLTSESKPATTESKPAPQTTEQKPATQADSKPLTSESKPVTTESKPAPQTTEQKPAAQADSKPLTSESKPATTESKPAPQTTEQKPATQADSKPLTSESKPATTESKPAPQTTEQKPATQADSKPLTSESKPVTTESKPAPQTTEQKPAAQADSKPLTSESKPVTTESKPAPQTTEQKPAAQADSKPLTSESKPVTTESKPAPQTTEQKPAAQADSKPLTSESKPVTTESKPAPQSTEQKPAATADSKPTTLEAKPNNFGSTSVNLSFNAIQSSSYGGMDIMPGMTIPVSHFGNLDNDTIQPNQKALEALKLQARLLEAQISSAEQELLKSKQVTESTNKPVENLNTPKAPVSDGDEALTQQQVSKPSIVPNGDTSKAPVADGDEALTQQQVSKPNIVPSSDTSKAPVADGDEALTQQQVSKPSIVPNGDSSKAPVADGDEALTQQQVSKPSIVPNGDTSKAPVSDGDDALTQQQVSKPSIVPNGDASKAPVADGDEALTQQQVSKPSIVPNGDSSKAHVADGDEALTQQQVSKPSIVPNGDASKAPVADGDEALTQQQVSKPSIVPSGDTSKAPVADGEEALTQQQVSKPSIVPSGDASKAPVADGDEALVQQQGAKPGVMSGGADAEIEESLIVPKPNVVVEGEAEFVAKEPSASMPNVAGSVPTPSDKAAPSTVGKGNLYAKLYGAMQQGHYEDAHIQQPTVSDKSTQSAQSNLGFNSELAKPMGSSSSSIAGAGALNGMALTEDAEITLEDGEPNTSNLVAKEQAKGPAVAPDKAVVSDEDVSAKTATHTSATDVSKTKEVLAERAQEAQKQQEVLKDKQATKEERLENKQDKQVKEEQVVQEEFVATMQARAQKAEIAVEQAALRAIQAQNTAPGGGHIDEDGGSVNQFSRLYQNTLSEQKTEQARVLGSSQVNTVGDTNIKATGTTIASNTTQNTEEANQNAPQNQVTGNRTHTVGTTTVEQANRLLGAGDASTNAPTPQTQAHSAQGTQGAALTQGAQGSAAQTQSQSQTQGTVQGQAPAPSTNAPSAQGQTPAQGSVPTPNTTTSPNTPTTNQNVQSAAPSTSSANPSVGSVAGTQSVEGAANKGMMPMPNMSAPVINLDEDSLQDEIIKNVMQTVPSDEFEEFNLKNGPLGNQALSGVIADTDLTEDNNSFNQILNKSQGITNNMLSSLSDPATVIPTTSAVGASQITSGENAPIPEESVVNNINTPKEGGFFRRLASLFGRKEESAPVASENIDKSVDPSKVALEKGIGQSEGTTKAQESAVAIANLRTNSLDALVSRLQSATTDQALPPKMQEQAQNLIKALQNPVHDLKTVSSWLNFVTGPMSPSSSQAMALHQWAFMLLCIRFEQIGKNVDKFLKKTANGDQKLASLEPAIKEHAKLTKELDEVSVNKSHELLKETFGQVERMQQQMQSIPQDQSVLRYIPLPPNYQGGKEGSFSAQKRQDEDGGTSWHLNFNLDLENLGGLQVKVKLRFPEIQMSFVAEKFETLQKVQAHMPELNARLKEIGLTSKGSNARLGAVNFMQPSKESSKSKFKFEGNAFNVDA